MSRKNKNKSNEILNTGTVTTNSNNSSNDSWKKYLSKNFDYMGKKNKTKYPEFTNLCLFSQGGLKILLERKLIKAGYEDVISGDGFIYAKGDIPVLLTAHMDTVHKNNVIDFYEYYDKENKRHIISSPEGIGGDDRCGIYMILEIIKTHKCSVLFCEDEESGCVGSTKFCCTDYIHDLSELKYLIELDRANSKDAVFYDCANDEFTQFILDNTGYEEDWGSCSDISTLAPACGVAAVNFSCGYYNAHTTHEYVIVEEMLNTIEIVKNLLDVECEQFEYIAKKHYYGKYGCYDWGYDDYDCYNAYEYEMMKRMYGESTARKFYGKQSSSTKVVVKDKDAKGTNTKNTNAKRNDSDRMSIIIYVYSEIKDDVESYVYHGTSVAECMGRFFMENTTFCYDDIYDYYCYEELMCAEGRCDV